MLSNLETSLAKSGYDLFHVFPISCYNSLPGVDKLPSFGREHAMGVLIGNSRALWPKFRKAYQTRSNPLDEYTIRSVTEACGNHIDTEHTIMYAHNDEYQTGVIAFQKLGHASGFAFYNPDLGLSVHSKYGPWFAYRAVVSLNCDYEGTIPAIENPCENCNITATQNAFKKASLTGRWTDWVAYRSTCTVGRKYRYSRNQMTYHYTNDTDLLEKGVV